MLHGLKVVEFATYVAGPSAATILAEWGADVIKVERSDGDPTRHLFDGRPELDGNPVFEFENRGKRGIVLDVTRPDGRAALLRILADADVLITNLRKRTLDKTGLDYATISELLPKLIYCGVSGYGSAGEAADWPAFDIAALWTRAGIAGLAIPDGIDPFPCRPGMGDSVCALASVSAILAALVERTRTGKGRLVETSLMRAGVYAVGWDLSMQLKFGDTDPARPRSNAKSALSNYYRCLDGKWVCMMSRSPDDWTSIQNALGLSALSQDARFLTPDLRLANAADLIALLDATFANLTRDEAISRLTAHDLIVAPLHRPDEVVTDPIAQAAGCFVDVEDAYGRRFASPAMPASFPGFTLASSRPAPRIGEHTREVLGDAGYNPEEVDRLIASGCAST